MIEDDEDQETTEFLGTIQGLSHERSIEEICRFVVDRARREGVDEVDAIEDVLKYTGKIPRIGREKAASVLRELGAPRAADRMAQRPKRWGW